MPTDTAHGIRPTEKAPQLDLPLVGGGRFVLADQDPERFTMLVSNRGLHRPVCRAQLAEDSRRLGLARHRD